MKKINVYFRKFPAGDVIALWGDQDRLGCIESYMIIEQHGKACPGLIKELPRATDEEKSPLMWILETIGYDVTDAEKRTAYY